MIDTTSHIAREALDLARNVEMRVNGHEDICAVRYGSLDTKISNVSNDVGDVKRILAWAGTTGFAVILSVLGFLMKAQFDANAEMQRTIMNLQQSQSLYGHRNK